MFSQNTMLLVQKQLTSFFAVRQRFSGQFPREFLLLCCGFCPTTRETIDLELVNVLVYVPHQFLLELNYGNQLLAFVTAAATVVVFQTSSSQLECNVDPLVRPRNRVVVRIPVESVSGSSWKLLTTTGDHSVLSLKTEVRDKFQSILHHWPLKTSCLILRPKRRCVFQKQVHPQFRIAYGR